MAYFSISGYLCFCCLILICICSFIRYLFSFFLFTHGNLLSSNLFIEKVFCFFGALFKDNPFSRLKEGRWGSENPLFLYFFLSLVEYPSKLCLESNVAPHWSIPPHLEFQAANIEVWNKYFRHRLSPCFLLFVKKK